MCDLCQAGSKLRKLKCRIIVGWPISPPPEVLVAIYYCKKEIESETDLTEHRERCHGASKIPSLFSLPVRPPSLVKHTLAIEHCDFCDMEFNTLGELQSHMRCQHKEILPS